MIRRPPRSTQSRSSAASDVYKRQSIDGLNPLEPLAGMDIGKIKRRVGEKVVLIGNIDCSHLLPFGTTEEVRKEVKKTIEVAASGSGFILASSSELHNEIPLEN